MASYQPVYPAPAGSFYPEYLAQPSYRLEPHPYGGNYTTNPSLLPPLPVYERSSRRTVSPASSAEHSAETSKGHRRRRSSVYLDGDHIIVTGGSPSRRDRERLDRARERELEEREHRQLEKEDRRRRRHEKREREAAVAAAMPIPLPRSSTMPTGHTIAPAYETRGRRPIITADYVDSAGEASARIPIGIDIIEHASRPSRSSSKRFSTSTTRYDRQGSPLGYASNEDEVDRRRDQRRRLREEVRAVHHGGQDFPSSAPERGAYHHYDDYSSSYGSSTGSGFTPPPATRSGRRMSSTSRASPAVEATTKNLRWADEERRRGILDHNKRIEQRPKLSRSESVKPNRPLQTEIKSILKNGTGSGANSANSTGAPTTPTSASRPASSERRRRDSFSAARREDPLQGLSSAMGGLSTMDRDDPEYKRLAERFSRPTRRHSTFGPGAGSGFRTDYTEPRRW